MPFGQGEGVYFLHPLAANCIECKSEFEYGMASIEKYVAVSQSLRQKREDAYSIAQLACGAIFVGVFDGHNGREAALWCAENMARLLETQFKKSISTVTAIKNAFSAAHESIKDQSGTTASVLLLHPGYVVIAHVGDSGVKLIRRGRSIDVTQDHHASVQSELCRFIERELKDGTPLITGNRIDGLMVTRSIGDHELVDEIIPFPVINEFLISKNDEYLIIATDGFWDVCNGDTAIQIVDQHRDLALEGIADALVGFADQQYRIRRLRGDDITCCIVDLQHENDFPHRQQSLQRRQLQQGQHHEEVVAAAAAADEVDEGTDNCLKWLGPFIH